MTSFAEELLFQVLHGFFHLFPLRLFSVHLGVAAWLLLRTGMALWNPGPLNPWLICG